MEKSFSIREPFFDERSAAFERQELNNESVSEIPVLVGGKAADAKPRRPEVEAVAAATPPLLIGGVNTHESREKVVSVHWIAGTCPTNKLTYAIACIDRAFFGGFEKFDYGLYRYDRSIRFEAFDGLAIYYDGNKARSEGVHRGRFTIVIPGKALDSLTPERMRSLMWELTDKLLFTATRIDVYWDDFERRITPSEVARHARAGNFAGYRLYELSGRKMAVGGEVESISDMVTFGCRGKAGSGRFLRVYDKNLESKGLRDCIRWEVEFTKSRAKQVMVFLASSRGLPEFTSLIAALVGGSIDFIERPAGVSRGNIDRMKRLDWWQEILDVIGQSIVRNRKRHTSIEASKAWMESISSTLGMVKIAMGDVGFYEWIREVTEVGKDKMKSRHHAMLSAYFAERGVGQEEVIEHAERIA